MHKQSTEHQTPRHVGVSDPVRVDPKAEHVYWSEHYATRPYTTEERPYEQYAPAYEYGWDSFSHYAGKRFDEVEDQLQRGWSQVKGSSALAWDHAKAATRDAWNRVEAKVSAGFEKNGEGIGPGEDGSTRPRDNA
jgi:hypothetical protein